MSWSMSLIWPAWASAAWSQRRREGRPIILHQHNIKLVWLTGRLVLDFRTIADFRKDYGGAIRKGCREFDLKETAATAPAETAVSESWTRATDRTTTGD